MTNKAKPVKELNPVRDWLFRQVHAKNLVYNTCWEDPRCDRQLLDLKGDSEIVMITSAGCNALDYLIDQPASINCIDVNPRQNALLQLKLATLREAKYKDLFRLFGEGVHDGMEDLYREKLRSCLPGYARSFWDKNLNYFNGKGVRQSFYHYSTSGTFAWMTNHYLRARRAYQHVCALFEAESLEQQATLYYQVEKRLFNSVLEWMVNRHLAMCLVGVPRSQQQLFRRQYERGALGFIQESLRKVFTRQSLRDNYFWRLYLQGCYSQECCPSYLQSDNFTPLRQGSNRIQTYTSTISDFLKANPKDYTHYVLLDHQDWLADNNRAALNEEWQLILSNSRPGTRILLRSAAEKINFFPDFVLDRVHFEQEKTQVIHQQDRVGTYASVYLGIVQ